MQVADSTLILSRHRWTVPVVARLQQGDRLGPASLASALGSARSALSRPLVMLQRQGWVHREATGLVLAGSGLTWGAPCQELVQRVRGHEELAFRRWTLPVLQALQGWELRFNELRALLPDATSRALIQALKPLIATNWVQRTVLTGFPPVAVYGLTSAGLELCLPLGSLPQSVGQSPTRCQPAPNPVILPPSPAESARPILWGV